MRINHIAIVLTRDFLNETLMYDKTNDKSIKGLRFRGLFTETNRRTVRDIPLMVAKNKEVKSKSNSDPAVKAIYDMAGPNYVKTMIAFSIIWMDYFKTAQDAWANFRSGLSDTNARCQKPDVYNEYTFEYVWYCMKKLMNDTIDPELYGGIINQTMTQLMLNDGLSPINVYSHLDKISNVQLSNGGQHSDGNHHLDFRKDWLFSSCLLRYQIEHKTKVE